jgi:ADP-ribose pyrophosphatase YjhB (NUDIX family)
MGLERYLGRLLPGGMMDWTEDRASGRAVREETKEECGIIVNWQNVVLALCVITRHENSQ